MEQMQEFLEGASRYGRCGVGLRNGKFYGNYSGLVC